MMNVGAKLLNLQWLQENIDIHGGSADSSIMWIRDVRKKFTALIVNNSIVKLHCIGFVGTAQELHIHYVAAKALLESTSSKFYVCHR